MFMMLIETAPTWLFIAVGYVITGIAAAGVFAFE